MYILSDDQINAIRTSIESMLDKTRGHMTALDGLCDSDYLKGRAKYPLAAVVYTGFEPEEQCIPDFTIQKIQYGKGRFMPEIYNKDAVIQIYSDTADFCATQEVGNKIRANGERFQVVQFTIDNTDYHLEKLEQISFDGFTDKDRAKIAERKVIFQAAEI